MSVVVLSAPELRRCMGQFATGVTVVTYWDEDEAEPRGATMNAFTSVSLDPPLVLISVAKSAKACGRLEDKPFAVNVLGADQLAVAMQFAGRPSEIDLRWDREGDAPHLEDALAWIECTPWASYDGGDHRLFLGEIQRLNVAETGSPLVFFAGRFRSVGAFTDHPIALMDGPEPGWLGGVYVELPNTGR
jgi:flavin reductase (DIM6/NTAB) family NADH-FMN oxidoreductase RutF